ncbi:aminotransferase class III-fold pyridoxal phosphate-dependent enzyme [Prolixibacteraceae bacterium JC049]|nr:aminotransferase class III-fold pyridoxal phosphate-dependent enzyme [Prolixibacteraceae bacterium JC049]
MDLFNVYPLLDIEPVKAEGFYVFDSNGNKYLDLYGGHAVISVGHSHPVYVKQISKQLKKIGFYSNSVQNPLQKELAKKLGRLSGYPDYSLFLCNSGAEANENALKLASFHTEKERVIAFERGFHGRTSAAVAVTDNPNIVAPVNGNHEVTILPLGDVDALEIELRKDDVCAVIIEGIQGIGGIHIPDPEFLKLVQQLCKVHNTVLILDEIQSGYGRSGKFFAHQYAEIQPDVITVAKGMGNGFPVGGVLISPEFEASFGLLGTTFGGNHLACAAATSVLNIMKEEALVENAAKVGEYLIDELKKIPEIKEVRGVGLMIGIEFDQEIAPIRKDLLNEHFIFTGVSGKHVIRLLPPLSITEAEAHRLVVALKLILSKK